MALEILRSNTDGVNGHISVHVRATEELTPGQVTIGPVEVVGIDHQSLMNIYHGASIAPTPETMNAAIVKWLAAHHVGAIKRKRAIEASSLVVDGLKGKIISFEEVSS